MPLSSDLVSQFVKSTKDDKNIKKENIIYGKVISYDDSTKTCTVRFDGAQPDEDGNYNDTLVTKLTSKVDEGERVTVMIKNHTATITGNLKDPAVGQSYLSIHIGDPDSIPTSLIDSLWNDYFI